MRQLTLLLVVTLAGCGHPASPTTAAAEPPASSPAPSRSLDVGDRAPGAAAGRVTLIFFWASWSEPDKKAMPKMQEIYLRHAAEGLDVLGIDIDDEPRGEEAARQWGARFPTTWDHDHVLAERFQPSAEPSFYIVDRRGFIRYIHRGYPDGEALEMEHEIVTLLGAAPRP